MKELLEAALANRAHEYAAIPTSALTFVPELLKACESNICGSYNKNWACPPGVGTMEEQRRKILAWANAMVFTTRYQLEDSFDFEGMTEAKHIHDRLTREMREKFSGRPIYGAGGCNICENCAYPEPCRNPGKVYSSIEAAGINVTELSRAAGVKYNNGENTVTYFSMILYN
ncbi:hypothetical protein FACS1894163_02640 [Spirochaetia bacterium]|nr:hypothetical protein FACS1894163_02640 [Spirochaetia bacterium]